MTKRVSEYVKKKVIVNHFFLKHGCSFPCLQRSRVHRRPTGRFRGCSCRFPRLLAPQSRNKRLKVTRAPAGIPASRDLPGQRGAGRTPAAAAGAALPPPPPGAARRVPAGPVRPEARGAAPVDPAAPRETRPGGRSPPPPPAARPPPRGAAPAGPRAAALCSPAAAAPARGCLGFRSTSAVPPVPQHLWRPAALPASRSPPGVLRHLWVPLILQHLWNPAVFLGYCSSHSMPRILLIPQHPWIPTASLGISQHPIVALTSVRLRTAATTAQKHPVGG